MATIDSLSQPSVSAEVEPTFKAVRVTDRPLEYIAYGNGGQQRVLGHYKVAFSVGAQTWGAGEPTLFGFRYGDANSFCVLHRCRVTVAVVSSITAQSISPLGMQIVRGWTQAFTGNAQNIAASSIGGNSMKTRTSMQPSTMSVNGNLQTTTAAAGLTGGTLTFDPIAATLDYPPVPGLTLGNLASVDLYKYDKTAEHPFVFASNEGFIVFWGANALATGSVAVHVNIDWAEVAEF